MEDLDKGLSRMSSKNKTKSLKHCRLEIPVEHVAAFGDQAIDFVDAIIKSLRNHDDSIELVLTAYSYGESSERTLKLLIEKSSLPFREAEELLDDVLTKAYEAFDYPDIDLIAAIR